MELRPATIEDAPAIAVVHVASIREAYRGLFPAAALDGIDTNERAERWRQTLADPGTTTLVAEWDGQVVGFINYGPCRDPDVVVERVGEIMSIYVAPAAWGVGAGRRLLQGALERLAGSGFRAAKLWTLDRNRRASAFYAHAGFVRDGTVKQSEMYGIPIVVVRYHTGLLIGRRASS